MDRVTVNIETQGGMRASEIIADLRATAETLYYPMTLVGFWDYRAEMHLCARKRSGGSHARMSFPTMIRTASITG